VCFSAGLEPLRVWVNDQVPAGFLLLCRFSAGLEPLRFWVNDQVPAGFLLLCRFSAGLEPLRFWVNDQVPAGFLPLCCLMAAGCWVRSCRQPAAATCCCALCWVGSISVAGAAAAVLYVGLAVFRQLVLLLLLESLQRDLLVVL
jgi:hypothetical protein